ncbi:MAG: hypothetical protein K2P14_10450 [Anaeroplasmataceae bacterium]|nr:hypothetical protein [Anaeroplasmataceae bacterium]
MDEILLAYTAEKYTNYISAKVNYNIYHKFSDLMSMLDNGIACGMFTQEELKDIINKQDEITQRILLMQYGKYITV